MPWRMSGRPWPTWSSGKAARSSPTRPMPEPTRPWRRRSSSTPSSPKGMCDEGLAELEQAVTLAPGNTNWLGQLGQAYGLAGELAKARDVLQQLEVLSRQRYVSPYHMAYVYVGLGEQDTAIDWLERAYVERAG